MGNNLSDKTVLMEKSVSDLAEQVLELKAELQKEKSLRIAREGFIDELQKEILERGKEAKMLHDQLKKDREVIKSLYSLKDLKINESVIGAYSEA